MGLFKSSRQKLLEKYHSLFKTVTLYGAVYGYLLRNADTNRAERFKSNFDSWRQEAILFFNRGKSREEASMMVDEFFGIATANDGLIPTLTDAKARVVEQEIIEKTETIRDILKERGLYT